MEKERKLDDIASLDPTFRAITSEVLVNIDKKDLKEQIDDHAVRLAAIFDAAPEQCGLESLRTLVKAFNDLDAQAVDIIGGELERLNGADYMEAMTRRIGHHILRASLSHIKTRNHRIGFRNRVLRRQAMEVASDTGLLEASDFQALREEAEQVELGKE